MRTRTQNAYILSLLFTLFSFIGTTHAVGKLVEMNKCYLSNSLGYPVDEKGKLLHHANPIYILEWKKENDNWIVTKPSPTTELTTRREEVLGVTIGVISFSHTYQKKPPGVGKIVDMVDKWELAQDIGLAKEKDKSNYWDLNITFDPKHKFMVKTPKRVQHKIYCTKTEEEVSDDATPDTASEKSIQNPHSEVKGYTNKVYQDGKEDHSCATANFVELTSPKEDVSQCPLD